jgi:hypothetical protein
MSCVCVYLHSLRRLGEQSSPDANAEAWHLQTSAKQPDLQVKFNSPVWKQKLDEITKIIALL